MKSKNFHVLTVIWFINLLINKTFAVESYLNSHGDCNIVPKNEEDHNVFCRVIYNSKKCQSYFKYPEKIIGEDYDELDIISIYYYQEKGKAICQYDEYNKLCPIGQYYIDVNKDNSVNENDYLKNSCKSKICSEVTLNYLLAKERYYSLKYPNKMDSFSKTFEEQIKLLQCNNNKHSKEKNKKAKHWKNKKSKPINKNDDKLLSL